MLRGTARGVAWGFALMSAGCVLGTAGTGGPPAAEGPGGHAGSGGADPGPGAGGGGGGPPPVECPPYTPGDRMDVCAATYLGGTGPDQANAVDIAPDGSIVVAGVLAGGDLQVEPVALSGGGAGAVLRLSPDGRQVRSLTRIGQVVSDMEVDRETGNIAIIGDFGVAMLDPQAKTLIWQDDHGNAEGRVSVGEGIVAALANNQIKVLDARGAEAALISMPSGEARDVAVDAANLQVVVTGARQGNPQNCPSNFEMAFVRSYSFEGDVRWKAYDWTDNDVTPNNEDLCARTRGTRVALGRDGKLYFAGESQGDLPKTIFRRNAADLDDEVGSVEFDAYNQLSSLGPSLVGYYARLSTSDGATEAGQFIVPRLGNGQGNTARPFAITADEGGRVFVGGETTCCMEHRDGDLANTQTTLSINGITVGPYRGYEGFVLIASPDLQQRLTWTTWTGSSRAPKTQGIAAGQGLAAMVSHQAGVDAGSGRLITVSALQPEPAGNDEAFLSIWSAP